MTDFTNKDIEFGWLSGENGWGDGMNENLQRVSNLLLCTVISATTTAPPGSPTDGDGYLVPTGATGVWVGHEGELAYWSDLAADWLYFTPLRGWQVTSQATDLTYYYTGSAWQRLYARVANGIQLPGSTLKLGTDASGTNAAATSVTQTAPLSTGNATPAALVWQVGVQGSSGSTPQAPTEGFRVQEVANASGREVALWNPSGSVMGRVALNTVAAAFEPDDGGRFGTRLRVIRFGATTAGAQVQGVFARGTADTPTAVQSGDGLLVFGGQGFDGSNFNQQASVRIVATEAWTGSARGAEVQVVATASGSTTQQGVINFRRASGVTAAEMVSGSATLRLIPGATQFAIRDSGNTADTFTVNAAGTAITAPLATSFQVASLLHATTPAAGETSLWLYDADNATLERVTVGAADSGGVGYKVLRIPN